LRSTFAGLSFYFCIQSVRLSCYHFKTMSENIVTPSLSALERIVRYWIPVALMLSLMYFFSTDVFSGKNTAHAIEWIMKLFGKDLSRPELGETNLAVRKFAHFFEYAILASLLFRAFRAESPALWRFSWTSYSFAIVVVWSLLDEFHQTFTTRRGGSLYDAMIDSAGGLFALLCITIYFRRKKPGASQPGKA
jgi:VanZ family protein